MPRFKQLLSIALLVAGVVLVFAGLTRSVGFSLAGIAASLAAVVALLYSGAVFFGTYPVPHTITPDTIFVFDRTFRLVAGVHKGLPIRAVLPAGLPGDLDARCTAVFAGKSERFEYAGSSRPMQAHLVPVRDANGAVQFGMLMLNHQSSVQASAQTEV